MKLSFPKSYLGWIFVVAAYILSGFILGRYVRSACDEMGCMVIPFVYLFPWGYIVVGFLVLPILNVLGAVDYVEMEPLVVVIVVIGTFGTFFIGWFFYKIGAYIQGVLRRSDHQ